MSLGKFAKTVRRHRPLVCLLCRKCKPLQIHHMLKVAHFPELKYEIGNCHLVCRDCHPDIELVSGILSMLLSVPNAVAYVYCETWRHP